MPPDELREARARLRMTGAQLARNLRLGTHGDRTVRRWEAGDRNIPGPVAVAIEMMLEYQERPSQQLWAAAQAALAEDDE